MTDQATRTASHRVILSACEAMEKQLLIEADNIENDTTVKLDTARLIAVTALAKAFKDDHQTMYDALDWFIDSMTAHLYEMAELPPKTKH